MVSKWRKRAIFLIPVLILIGMTVTPLLTILTGKEVLLTTQPVDPRDLFRGDYVTLQYEAEQVHPSKIEQSIKDYFKERETSSMPYKSLNVYALLEESEQGTHEVVMVVKDRPEDGLYLKGEIEYLWNSNEEVFVHYNLDRYFVPENTGKVLEDAIRTTSSDDNALTNVIAVVKVRNGHAVLSNVEVIN